jgi:hypothetical protein
MSCFKIRLSKPTKYTESDGYTYLDLEPDSDLRSSKVLSELNEVKKLKFDITEGVSLQSTPKNFDILSDYFHGNIIDNNYNPLNADIITGSKIHQNNRIYVLGYNKEGIEINLVTDTNHWAYQLSKKKLSDVSLGEFTLDCTNIEYINQDYPSNGMNYITFPYVDYGILFPSLLEAGRRNELMMPLSVNRPWFRIHSIIKKVFCSIGYDIISPILESELGLKMIAYLMDKTFGTDDVKKQTLNASAIVTNEYIGIPFTFSNSLIGVVPFNSIPVNISGALSSTGEYYSANGVVNIKGKLGFRLGKKGQRIVVHFGVQSVPTGSSYNIYNDILIGEATASEDDQEVSFDFDIENYIVTTEHKLCISVRKTLSSAVGVLKDSSIEYIGVRKFWENGETFEIAKLIDNSYNCLEFFKGIVHALNLKLYTDRVNNKLYALQPYEIDFYDTLIEGFYLETDFLNYELNQDLDSVQVTTPDRESPRYIVLKYKDASDQASENIEKLTKKPLWSKTVDLGENFVNEDEEEDFNPFFEPVALKEVDARPGRVSAVMVMDLRSEDTQSNWDIEPKLAIDFGLVKQDFGTSSPKLRRCNESSALEFLIPTAGPLSFIKLSPHNMPSSTTELSYLNVIYGNTLKEPYNFKTLYEFFYKRFYIEELNNLKINYLTYISRDEFSSISFRNYVYIRHLGRLIKCRISIVEDFAFCSNIFTPITYIPEKSISNICELYPEEPEVVTCDNYPTISVVRSSDSCFLVTLGGVNDDIIDNVVIQWRPVGGMTWLAATVINLLQAEVCGQINPFEVRATVTYENCPEKITPVVRVVPCPEVNFELQCVKSFDIATNTTFFTSIIVSSDSSVIYTASQYEVKIDGGIWNPFNPNARYIGNIVEFKVNVRVGICPIQALYVSCDEFLNPRVDCEDVYINLVCEEVSTGCWIFLKDGFIPAALGDYDTFIKYRCEVYNEETDTFEFLDFQIWDGEPVCCNRVQARMFVHFCNDTCPMICTDIIECYSFTGSIACVDGVLTANIDGDDTGCVYSWIGPEGFSASGNPITIPMVSGEYMVHIVCGELMATFTYNHDVPYAGEDTGPTNWED